MSEPAGKPHFREIYREQYREVSSSKTSRAFRWITPIGFAVIAVLEIVFGHGDRHFISIILGTVAAMILVGVIMYAVRRRRSRG